MKNYALCSANHPGYLYVAESDAYPGTLKVGRTSNVKARIASLGGAESMAVWRLCKAFPVKDMVEAEHLAKSALRPFKSIKPGAERRQELFDASLECVLEACAEAAAAVGAVVDPHCAVRASRSLEKTLVSTDATWQALLAAMVRFDRQEFVLGDVMLLSLSNNRAAKRLAQLGVVCTRWCNDTPDFEALIDKGTPLYQWADAMGVAIPGGNLIKASFSVESRVS